MEQFAIPLCCAGIAFLFHLNRDKSVATSKGLWVPVIWIWIACSRSVSSWFGMGNPRGLEGTLDGSPMDATVIGALQIIGLIVLLRGRQTGSNIRVILPIAIYSVYGLM